ncbi:MAG: SpoVR family protein [Myxococcota bacterium]
MNRAASLPSHLAEMQQRVERAARELGLDFFETVFEVLDYKKLNEVASYGGFPTRYPHWRFGMEFEQLSKGHRYGLQKIYEMVINNNPAYAYLLESNAMVEQKLVMAHVLAHVDFFKNNYYFSKTNRKMIDTMANHATRVRRHIDRHGLEKVETFVDVCLSLDNMIDPLSPFIVRKTPPREEDAPAPEPKVIKLRAKAYMDKYVNPPEFLEAQRKRSEKTDERIGRTPEQPERDVLQFLIDHAPLERWERDILELVREEAYYYAPQMMTKIMNEGWASFFHSKLMTSRLVEASELIDYADANAGVLSTSSKQLNPYKLGVELYRHIEERWDKGRFGREWQECDDYEARRTWDRRLGMGRKKIFEVRALYNDVTFIDEFLTEDFCREQKLFNFGWNERASSWEIQSREFKQVKEKLLFQLTNFGHPFVYVEEANFENRGELLLRHRHEGHDLKVDWARDTLVNLERVWHRPVNLLTRVEGKGKLLRFDGHEHTDKSATYPEA